MNTITLELRTGTDDHSGTPCGAWIEVQQGCPAGRKTDLSFAAGSLHKTVDSAALGRDVVF